MRKIFIAYRKLIPGAMAMALLIGGSQQVCGTELVPATGEPQEFIDIAKDLRCPTCTGLSVLDSDAPFSLQIKNEVKDQLRQGRTEKEIMSFFTERYGPWILREPPKSGANLIAWLVPMVVLLAGPILLWLLVWRKRQTIPDYGVRNAEDIEAEFHRQVEAARQ